MLLDEHARHRCEVRQVLRWRAELKDKAIDYLQRVEKARGLAARQRIEDDCKAQWQRGNRGEKDVWR